MRSLKWGRRFFLWAGHSQIEDRYRLNYLVNILRGWGWRATQPPMRPVWLRPSPGVSNIFELKALYSCSIAHSFSSFLSLCNWIDFHSARSSQSFSPRFAKKEIKFSGGELLRLWTDSYSSIPRALSVFGEQGLKVFAGESLRQTIDDFLNSLIVAQAKGEASFPLSWCVTNVLSFPSLMKVSF